MFRAFLAFSGCSGSPKQGVEIRKSQQTWTKKDKASGALVLVPIKKSNDQIGSCCFTLDQDMTSFPAIFGTFFGVFFHESNNAVIECDTFAATLPRQVWAIHGTQRFPSIVFFFDPPS